MRSLSGTTFERDTNLRRPWEVLKRGKAGQDLHMEEPVLVISAFRRSEMQIRLSSPAQQSRHCSPLSFRALNMCSFGCVTGPITSTHTDTSARPHRHGSHTLARADRENIRKHLLFSSLSCQSDMPARAVHMCHSLSEQIYHQREAKYDFVSLIDFAKRVYKFPVRRASDERSHTYLRCGPNRSRRLCEYTLWHWFGAQSGFISGHMLPRFE